MKGFEQRKLEIGNMLKSRAEELGLSTESVAAELDMSLRNIWRYYAGEIMPSRPTRKRMVSKLGISEARLEALANPSKDHLVPMDLFAAAEKLGSIKAVTDRMDEIYEQWPEPDEDESDYGDLGKWAVLFEKHGDCARLIFRERTIVGYWSAIPVPQKVYQEFLSGKNVNSKITASGTMPLLPGSNYLYMVDFFEDKSFSGNALNRAMLISFMDFLLEAAMPPNDFYFDGIVANLSSEKVIGIADGIGFDFVCDHDEHKMELDFTKEIVASQVWEHKMDPQNECALWVRSQELRRLYTEHRSQFL